MNTLSKENKNKKFINGWLIVVACMFIQAIPFGVASNIQPLFIHPVTSDKGFSLPAFSLIFTLGTIVSAIASPFVGAAFSKFNVKLIYLIGCSLSGGGFLLFSICQELWQFYLVAGIVQVGTLAISSIGVPLLISAWFDEISKGKAMGLAFAGGSIGNIFLQQMTTYSLANFGYSSSYLFFGVLSLAVGIPITLFLLKMPNDPSQIVRGKNNSNKDEKKPSVELNYTLNDVKKIKYFWFLAVAFIFVGIYVSAYSVQYAAYFQSELKFDAATVGIAGSIFAVCSLGGNLCGGILFDKLGTVKTLIVSLVLVALSGIFLLMSSKSPIYAHLFSALKGLAVYAYMLGPSLLTGSFFGNKDFGSILGVVNLMFAVGFASGSSLFGVLVQSLGYNTSWMIILGAAVIAFTLLIIASIGMDKLNKEKLNSINNAT